MPGEYATLRSSEKLIRRARLRAILNSRSGKEGVSTLKELGTLLGVTWETVNRDIRAVGAVKVSDTIDGTEYQWWIVPAHNPNLPEYRQSMSDEAILNEVSLKVRAHALEIIPFGNSLIVTTERSAGPLLADWLSLLTWPEIVHVSEERNAAVVHTPDAEAAAWVRARLTGEIEEEE